MPQHRNKAFLQEYSEFTRTPGRIFHRHNSITGAHSDNEKYLSAFQIQLVQIFIKRFEKFHIRWNFE